MIVPKRELANTLNSSTSQPNNNQPSHYKHFSIDLESFHPDDSHLPVSIAKETCLLALMCP